MSQYYLIQIGTIYLSKTGTNVAPFARLQVVGIEDLLTTVIGVTEPSASGQGIDQTFPWTSNKPFEIQVETWLTTDVWNSLVALINDALENSSTFAVVGTGALGNFSVTAKPALKKPFQGETSTTPNRINKPIFRFITV